MEKYNLQNDLKVFGVQVKTFPTGIAEAFSELKNKLPNGNERPYYGISYCTDGNVTYIAAASEAYDGEGSKYGYENYSIDKGEYLTAQLTDWTSKTDCIKDVLAEIIDDERVDKMQPAIEVYKNMKEMICMVKIDQRKDLLFMLNKAIEEVKEIIAPLDEEQLNKIPFEGSWTAAQVVKHLALSHAGFAQILNGPAKKTERAADECVETIKIDFLDFTTKTESPQFVRPAEKAYSKERLISSIDQVKAKIGEVIQTLDLMETCTAFELPVYGYLTRLEAVNFVIYHTHRHIHQLRSIAGKVK